MRLLRFTLLINYFSNNKNKLKALKIINAGIFLSLFALTTAVISFFIENKINEQQFFILEEQKSKRYFGKIITVTENAVVRYDNHLWKLKDEIYEQSYLFKSNLFNKTKKLNELIPPYVFFSILDLETSIKDLKPEYNSYEEFIDVFIPFFDKFYSNDKEFLDILKEYIEEYKYEISYLQKLDKSKYYKSIFKPDYENIFIEIKNPLNYEIYFNEIYTEFSWDNLPEDYYQSYAYHRSGIVIYSALIDYFRGYLDLTKVNIKEAEEKIKYYSKLEKNLILLTFIFQFITFLIIQIFEFGSINRNKKSKLL